jgi:hypothetical protein
VRIRGILQKFQWTKLFLNENRACLGRGVNASKEMRNVNRGPFHGILKAKGVDDEHSIICKKFRHKAIVFTDPVIGLFT